MEKKNKLSHATKAKGFVAGFKSFITKGNVVDLAIGVIIGGAFGKIISSLVNDIILPPIGVLLGGVDFKDLKVNIAQVVVDGVPQVDPVTSNPIYVTINYGNFIQVVLEFIIIALAIYALLFFIIKRKQFEEQLALEEAKKAEAEKPQEPAVPVVPEDIKLLTEIRDLLKK